MDDIKQRRKTQHAALRAKRLEIAKANRNRSRSGQDSSSPEGKASICAREDAAEQKPPARDDEPADRPDRPQYSSPPCYAHELDPLYKDT